MIQRHIEEELEANDRGVERDGGNTLIHQMQLIASQVFDGGAIRRVPKEERELSDGAQVVALGLVGELAQSHVVDHALTQRADGGGRGGHGSAPVENRGGLPQFST